VEGRIDIHGYGRWLARAREGVAATGPLMVMVRVEKWGMETKIYTPLPPLRIRYSGLPLSLLGSRTSV
jgi:hypothetical protein